LVESIKDYLYSQIDNLTNLSFVVVFYERILETDQKRVKPKT
jgi:hypothetical protein